MKEKIVVSVCTLVVSLLFYFCAKEHSKDVAPFVMIGGFLGALAGESILYLTSKDKDDEGNDE